MRKSFLILLGVLSISALIGIVFDHFIIELLFQRGAFTEQDTKNTALIFSMYLIGLLPYGLAKIFSLWLYSNNQQFTAAKISMKELLCNVLFSLILIVPLEAAGLALSSTLSGFILFFLTIKEFGFKRFFILIKG